MQTAAIVSQASGPVELVDDLEVDEPGTGEALVDIDMAGVCGTDLSLLNGHMPYPMPMVLGHEATGRVLGLGPATDGPPPGSRVTLWMRPPCRACRMCLRGQGGLCERSGRMSAKGTKLDGATGFSRRSDPVYRALGIGAFTTQVVMPVGGLVAVPDDVPPEVAALAGCGIATGAGAILNVAEPRPGDVVVVFGGGGVGLAAAMAAKAIGAGAVIVVDPVEERRSAALALGVTAAVPAADLRELRATIAQILGDEPVDIAIDAVGRPEIVVDAHRLVRQGGTVVAVGVQAADAEVRISGQLLALSHKRVLGCFMGGIDPQRDLPRLFSLYRQGVFPVDRLVGRHRPLSEVGAALEDLAAGRGVRTIIDMRA